MVFRADNQLQFATLSSGWKYEPVTVPGSTVINAVYDVLLIDGLAYVFFIIVGQIFAESVGRPEIRSSMQALIFAATTGVGLFFGTQLAGIVMDRFSLNGKFVWRKVWLVPATIMLLGVLALAVVFHDPPPAEDNAPDEAVQESEKVAALAWHAPAAGAERQTG